MSGQAISAALLPAAATQRSCAAVAPAIRGLGRAAALAALTALTALLPLLWARLLWARPSTPLSGEHSQPPILLWVRPSKLHYKQPHRFIGFNQLICLNEFM